MPLACPIARRAYKKRWDIKNHDHVISQAMKRGAKTRVILKEYVGRIKAEASCGVCGENEPACLDFHHRDPSQKDTVIPRAVNNGWSLARLKKEIAKCDIVCANCHRKIHAGVV